MLQYNTPTFFLLGFPAAVKAHAARNLDLAAHHYQRALEQNDLKEILFQNYGALLRELGSEKLQNI